MISHEFPDAAERCVHCGTLRANVNQTACPGPQRRDAMAGLRPEPARHQYASEAFDDIGKRVAELEAERTAAMNAPATDGGQ